MEEKLLFAFDKALIEKRMRLFTNGQLGFIGAALMLMMMDLSKLYLLAPLVVGLILSSWYKHHLEGVKEGFEQTNLEFSPKSVLIKIPATESEHRITFREMDDITLHQENFVPTLTIYPKDKEKVVIKALKDSEKCLEILKGKMAEIAELSK